MRTILILVTAALLLSAPAFSQDKISVFAGYSIFHLQTERLQNAPGSGWDVELSGKMYRFVGLVGDVSTYYRSSFPPGERVRFRVRNFLVGPRFTFDLHHVQPFVHVLLGASNLHVSATFVPGIGLEGSGGRQFPAGETGFTVAFGGGVDVPVARFLSIRPAKLEYVSINTGSVTPGFGDPVTQLTTGHTNNLRYSAGLVLRF